MATKEECISPTFFLIGKRHGSYMSGDTLAGSESTSSLRTTKIRSGWKDNPNVRIYKLVE